MKKSGIVIRLIDVVLNLLFGFLLLSDIVHKNQIKLPSLPATSRIKDQQKEEIVPIEIRIMPGDTVLADINPRTEKSLIKISQLHSYYRVFENERTYKFRLLEQLEEYLVETKAAYFAGGSKIVVIINPDPESMIQSTINLVDICRTYDIPRNFRYFEGSNNAF